MLSRAEWLGSQEIHFFFSYSVGSYLLEDHKLPPKQRKLVVVEGYPSRHTHVVHFTYKIEQEKKGCHRIKSSLRVYVAETLCLTNGLGKPYCVENRFLLVS